MRNLHVGFLTRANLNDRGLAGELLDTFERSHPDLRPLRFGGYEPLSQHLGPTDSIQTLLEHWDSPLLWNHRARAEGSFYFGRTDRYSAVLFSCTASRIPPQHASEVVVRLGELLRPDFAYAYHIESGRDYAPRYRCVNPFVRGITTHDLVLSLPDLPWLALFGEPYIELFGSGSLGSCPSFVSRPVSEHLWQLQLAAASTWPALEEQYHLNLPVAKEHLGILHFLDVAAPDAQRTAPPLEWARRVRNPLLQLLQEKNLLT